MYSALMYSMSCGAPELLGHRARCHAYEKYCEIAAESGPIIAIRNEIAVVIDGIKRNGQRVLQAAYEAAPRVIIIHHRFAVE